MFSLSSEKSPMSVFLGPARPPGRDFRQKVVSTPRVGPSLTFLKQWDMVKHTRVGSRVSLFRSAKRDPKHSLCGDSSKILISHFLAFIRKEGVLSGKSCLFRSFLPSLWSVLNRELEGGTNQGDSMADWQILSWAAELKGNDWKDTYRTNERQCHHIWIKRRTVLVWKWASSIRK